MGHIRVIYRANHLGYSRLAFAVSAKYGNAVERNRFKRQLRDAFRTSRKRSPGIDMLVIPLHPAKQITADRHAPVADFANAMQQIFARAGGVM